ncbi:hypothetical protein AGMMS50267_16930 [Spirochaetia bacterium]|nr:hypothetical protein AGMMS50267_16930 [Spirochaetia bacterium]
MMKEKNNALILSGGETEFYKQVADFLLAARQHAKRQIDSTIVTTYYEIGRMIVEREQQGEKRAQYGKKLLAGLADYLVANVDKRLSSDNLKLMRRFYIVYSDSQIGESAIPQFTQNVSWTHYIQLMRIENVNARHFYEIETAQNGWSIRQLQRQIGSSLYERLALSRDKDNRLLQCYVIIDLKIDELKHQDLGQMQMYVNYFDRCVKQEFEKPTVGILLCKKQNDSIVELTLPKDANIYASAYSLYLPDKALLQRKLAEWVEEFEETHGDQGDEV